MSDPQVWTLIGVFAASMFAALGLVVTLVNRSTRAAVDGLRGELSGDLDGLRGVVEGGFRAIDAKVDAKFEAVDARFAAVDARFEAVDAKFEAVNVKLDHLDRDVAVLMKREFGLPD